MSLLIQLKNEDKEEQFDLLYEFLKEEISNVLQKDLEGIIKLKTSFFSIGLNSVQIVVIKKRLEDTLSLSISTTALFDYPSIESFINFIISELEKQDTSGVTDTII